MSYDWKLGNKLMCNMGETQYWVKRELGVMLLHQKLGEPFWVKCDWVET